MQQVGVSPACANFSTSGAKPAKASLSLSMKSSSTAVVGTPSSSRSAAAAQPVRSLPAVQWNSSGSSPSGASAISR